MLLNAMFFSHRIPLIPLKQVVFLQYLLDLSLHFQRSSKADISLKIDHKRDPLIPFQCWQLLEHTMENAVLLT